MALEPAVSREAAVARLAALLQRLDDVTARAQRVPDVGGLLGPLESDASTTERDLIVGNARRRDAVDRLRTAQELRADLAARAAAVRHLAEICVRTVDPRRATPCPTSGAGADPQHPDGLEPYLQRLGRVSDALALAQQAYADALAGAHQLGDLLDAYLAKARALGIADRPDLRDSERRAREVLARTPAPMAVCPAAGRHLPDLADPAGVLRAGPGASSKESA